MLKKLSIFLFVILLAGCMETTEDQGQTEQAKDNPDIEANGENHPEENNQKEHSSEESKHENDSGEKEEEHFIYNLKDPSVAVLVNKEFSLGEDYEVEDLVEVQVPTVLENTEVNQLRKVAADALYEMFEAAKEEGIYLYARSGYRSYQTQVHLFNGYKEKHGEEAANRYSAKPGHSEHQTGLVMDVTSESVGLQLTEEFGETVEGRWLAENAHRFGFIIRYPKGKEEITGYIYEPWHIRYLGVELATAIYESQLTYEEYLEKEGIIDAVILETNEQNA